VSPSDISEDFNDEYDTFRKRYKDHEAVPTPRVRTERADSESTQRPSPAKKPWLGGLKNKNGDASIGDPPPEGKRPRIGANRPSGSLFNDYDDSDLMPHLRVGIIIAVVVVLAVMTFLIVRINSLSGQLKVATAQQAESADDARINLLTIEIEKRDERIKELEQQIDSLTVSGDQLAPVWDNPGGDGDETPGDGDEAPPDGAGSTRPDETVLTPSTPASGAYATHIVSAGETLSSIAQRYYGSARNFQRIKDYNGLTSDNLSIGQELRIPPAPTE
jgi:LysM repeat protein